MMPTLAKSLTLVVVAMSLSAQAAPKKPIPAVFCEGFRADDINQERPYVLRPSMAEHDTEAARKQGYTQALLLAQIDPKIPGQRLNPPSLGASRLHNLLLVGDAFIGGNKQAVRARFAPRNLDTMHSNELSAELTITDEGGTEGIGVLVISTRMQADRTLGEWHILTYNLKCSL